MNTYTFASFPQVERFRLPRTSTGEHKPTVEYGGAALAPTAWLDAHCGRSAFDDITQADSLILVHNEAGKTHLMRLASSLYHMAVCCPFLAQPIHLLALIVVINWYAAQASNGGGTIVFRRGA